MTAEPDRDVGGAVAQAIGGALVVALAGLIGLTAAIMLAMTRTHLRGRPMIPAQRAEAQGAGA